MQKRRLGKTEHMSTIITFGGFMLLQADQKEADAVIDMAIEAGINHIDVSPDYGKAEERLGSWFKRHGCAFFLGCKTAARTKKEAMKSLENTMKTLNVDHVELYQFHGVDTKEDLDAILGPEGALEAFLEARYKGLIDFIGITGHRPPLFYEALLQYDFDTVLFPMNRVHAGHFTGWNDWRPLIKSAVEKDAGLIAIKSVAKGQWADITGAHKYQTWYEPFDEEIEIDKSIRYALSQDIASAVTPGDPRLFPLVIKAGLGFLPMSEDEQKRVIAEVDRYQPLAFPGVA